jgi:hypothetical protein
MVNLLAHLSIEFHGFWCRLRPDFPKDHYYERWFREIRCKPKIKVIEIAANQGHSLNAWDTIFTSPGKTVLGLAYGGPAMGVEKKERRGVGVLFGDQSKKRTTASCRR